MKEHLDPNSIKWISPLLLKVMHAESLERFGGLPGLRDPGLLESALSRPRHLLSYGGAPTLFDLAARYASGIARNHPFVDGNKRAASLAVRAFLFLNGYHFNPSELELVQVMEALAEGRIDDEALAGWISANATERVSAT